MASLSRGCCVGFRPLAARTEFIAVRSRLFFSTSVLLRSNEPHEFAISVTRAPGAGAKLSAAVEPSPYAFIKSLAKTRRPTVLYEGPSHFWFYFGCWSSGITILTWTALTAPMAMEQPEGVPVWVGYIFGATYLLLGSMGAYLITKTPGVVSRIRVIPAVRAAAQATQQSPPVLAAAQAAQATKPKVRAAAPARLPRTPPQLEVTVKRMMPFLKPKVITTSLDNVTLKSRFSLPEAFVPELKRIEIQRAKEAERKAQRAFDMNHLLTAPFRQAGRGFSGMFNGMKSAWTDMGFGKIIVDGKQYKVDVTRGFAHNGFKTLEQLVKIEP